MSFGKGLQNQQYLCYDRVEFDNPSAADGVDLSEQRQLRFCYCYFLKAVGAKQKLPAWTIGTAHYYVHLFYAQRSLRKSDIFIVSCAALFLAAKVEESPRLMNSLLKHCWEQRYRDDEKKLCQFKDQTIFEEFKEQVQNAERSILYVLDFQFLVVLNPYSWVAQKIHDLKFNQKNNELSQTIWSLINDSYFTTLCIQFPGQKIGLVTMCIGCAIHKIEINYIQLMKECECSEEEFWNIIKQIQEIYEQADFKKLIEEQIQLQLLKFQESQEGSLVENQEVLQQQKQQQLQLSQQQQYVLQQQQIFQQIQQQQLLNQQQVPQQQILQQQQQQLIQLQQLQLQQQQAQTLQQQFQPQQQNVTEGNIGT